MESSSILESLMGVIAERRDRPAIGAKITEEAVEVVEAASEPGDEGRAHLVRETADLVFHTLVLLGHRHIAWAEVEAELARRFGIGGFEEKEARGR
jgi:phosphoribosyl-ATP pyrophosphohydrolase